MRLRRLAKMPAIHRKLLWGTDFPIPVYIRPFHRLLDRASRRALRATPSWIERDLMLKRFLGFDACVFTRAAELFGLA